MMLFWFQDTLIDRRAVEEGVLGDGPLLYECVRTTSESRWNRMHYFVSLWKSSVVLNLVTSFISHADITMHCFQAR